MDNKETLKKYAGAIARGSIGATPLVGPLAVELLNVTIPNQRQERIEKLLNVLSSKVFDIDSEQLKERFNSTDFVDIFEDVLFQSVRATSSERLEYLASILEKSLTEEEIKHLQTKRLLSILGEINDAEIIILQSYELEKQRDGGSFKERHKNIFKYEFVTRKSSQDERKQNTMLQNYKDHLVNLGLVGLSHPSSNSTLYLTPLGGMLLEKIGLEEEPTAIGEPISSLSGINAAEAKYQELKKEVDKNKPPKDTFRKSEAQEVQDLIEKIKRHGFR